MKSTNNETKVVVIGGGPAGLTAAYELCKAAIHSVVLEKDMIVGGLARTVSHNGYKVDIGGHRFFTKIRAVEEMWREVLPNGEFRKRARLSRIYYNKRFFYYPLRSWNALSGLGIWNSAHVLLSYVKARIFPQMPETTFEHWVSNRFGKRLYQIFFKTYTEKVWGIPCNRICAEWAAQRIKGLSLLSAIKNALRIRVPGGKAAVIKTLIDEFDYPDCGPGMMWERVAALIQQAGAELRLGAEVDKVNWIPGRVSSLTINTPNGKAEVEGSHFISSMPIRELVEKLAPPVPGKILHAARSLNYRDFILVAIVVNKPKLFPDNWIYVHDPDVKVGRIQNFKNWSERMVPDPSKTCLGLEYFCFEGDGLWTSPDEQLIQQAKRELALLRLASPADITEGFVVRMPKAYPVYDSDYQNALKTVRAFLETLGNLQLVGRNGMHKYNNQDHSMLTAMLAVQNILGARYDLWAVNADQDYQEEVRTDEHAYGADIADLRATQPHVPIPTALHHEAAAGTRDRAA